MLIMPKLPQPDDYELEYDYWPWGNLLKAVVKLAEDRLPKEANVCDYMCGTGFLLNAISHTRPDLCLTGCSLDADYIEYGQKKYPDVHLEFADALKWSPPTQSDAIICTAGLHHLERARQPQFIAKVASELAQGAFFFLGEELIADYSNENERRVAVQNLSARLLQHLEKVEAPSEVVQAAIDVSENDFFEHGEYKTTYREMLRMLEPHFNIESVEHFWPKDDLKIGDFLFVCCKK
jgi:trans-aconitate methyltransferase